MKQIHIHILKNGVSIQSFITTQSKLNSTLYRARDIAGGMWNGEDVFTVHIEG